MSYTYKQIWAVTLPVTMSILTEQLINITDAIFLGRVGETELGAAAVAGIYYLILYVCGFGFSLGLQVIIARRNGARSYNETGKTFFQGLYFLAALSILLLTLSHFVSPFLLKQLIASEEVYSAVMKYLEWRVPGLLFAYPLLAFRAFFTGIIRTRILSVSAVVMVVANIVLNYFLTFGHGSFPGWGISGTAISSTLSEAIGLSVLLVYTLYKVDRRHYGLSPVFDAAVLRKVFNLSGWSMFQSFISVAPWFLFFVAVEHLGQSQLAIANIVRSISTVFFVIISSLGTTTGSFVSNLIGAGEGQQIMPLCRKIIRAGYFAGIPLLILALVFHREAMWVYTPDKLLVQEAFWTYVVMLSNFFLALPANIYSNALTGTGRTRTAFFLQVITITLYLSYLGILSSQPGIPLAIYWTAEQFYVLLLFVFSFVYMKRKAVQEFRA